MPDWKYHLELEDLWDLTTSMPFEDRRDAIVRRVRDADFYDETDIVLRNIVNDVASAADLLEFDRHWDYVRWWADDHSVWLCTHRTANCPPIPATPSPQEPADMTTPARHPAFDDPTLAEALTQWCEMTGTDPDQVDTDPEFTQIAASLAAAELLDFATAERRQRMAPEAYTRAAELAALVLLAGAELARLRRTPVIEATGRVVTTVADRLGRPTGYERQPDLLARHIHDGTLSDDL
jgi:hypothetical protein